MNRLTFYSRKYLKFATFCTDFKIVWILGEGERKKFVCRPVFCRVYIKILLAHFQLISSLYGKQLIDLLCKSIDCLLQWRNIGCKRVKDEVKINKFLYLPFLEFIQWKLLIQYVLIKTISSYKDVGITIFMILRVCWGVYVLTFGCDCCYCLIGLIK